MDNLGLRFVLVGLLWVKLFPPVFLFLYLDRNDYSIFTQQQQPGLLLRIGFYFR